MHQVLLAFKNILMQKTQLTLKDIFTSGFQVIKISRKALGFTQVKKKNNCISQRAYITKKDPNIHLNYSFPFVVLRFKISVLFWLFFYLASFVNWRALAKGHYLSSFRFCRTTGCSKSLTFCPGEGAGANFTIGMQGVDAVEFLKF